MFKFDGTFVFVCEYVFACLELLEVLALVILQDLAIINN